MLSDKKGILKNTSYSFFFWFIQHSHDHIYVSLWGVAAVRSQGSFSFLSARRTHQLGRAAIAGDDDTLVY